MLKCKSRTLKEPKRGKNHSLWPIHTQAADLPECGGKITIALDVPSYSCCGGEYCYCDREFKVVVTCNRCQNPFIDEALQTSYPETRITELLIKGLELESNGQ